MFCSGTVVAISHGFDAEVDDGCIETGLVDFDAEVRDLRLRLRLGDSDGKVKLAGDKYCCTGHGFGVAAEADDGRELVDDGHGFVGDARELIDGGVGDSDGKMKLAGDKYCCTGLLAEVDFEAELRDLRLRLRLCDKYCCTGLVAEVDDGFVVDGRELVDARVGG